ncbi:unnamed protein product [Notodromas monacha]|uniref:Amidinotransferase n=1 Tax=Notodromas monacha TaxID=399045 RepID=A0A7R9BLN0_9CRUS|nr:unnamed protein product [Notodromas monacha]CAG0917490.1 unnamed protein product [Notodromas monacha]
MFRRSSASLLRTFSRQRTQFLTEDAVLATSSGSPTQRNDSLLSANNSDSGVLRWSDPRSYSTKTLQRRVLTSMRDVAQSPIEFEPMPPRRLVFMVTPEHFDVTYVINPHMDGKIGTVDKAKCIDQWHVAREEIKKVGVKVVEIPSKPGLPDMIYAANLGLPFPAKSGVEVYMSNMAVEERAKEVPHYAEACESVGYEVKYLPANIDFEGQGDALWHGTRRLIWAGYGFRTDLRVYDIISSAWKVPIVALKLHDPFFYHIDTALAILDNDTAVVYPKAFTDEGLSMIRTLIPRLIEVPESDAKGRLACNCFCPDGENVLIQAGSKETNRKLKEAGYNVIEVDVSEFLKGGGSICCMKMFSW